MVLLLQSALLPFVGTAGRCPGLIGVALSARFFVLDTAAGGKDHSGVAAREIVRIAKEESVV